MNIYYPDTKSLMIKDSEWQTSVYTTKPWEHWEFELPSSFTETFRQIIGCENAIKDVEKRREIFVEQNAGTEGSKGHQDWMSRLTDEFWGLVEKTGKILNSIWYESLAQLRGDYNDWLNHWMWWACRECWSHIRTGIEYSRDSPHHYDWISEWQCNDCKTRYDWWTDEIVEDWYVVKRHGWQVLLDSTK